MVGRVVALSGRFGLIALDALDPKYLAWIEALKKFNAAERAADKAAREGAANKHKLREKADRLNAEQQRLSKEGWVTSSTKIIGGRDSAKLATDPPVSEKQRRAMFAAKSGKSTLGIPKKVGEEFVGKDATQQIKIGDILQLSPTVRLRYIGGGEVKREDRANANSAQWAERGIVKLTDAQIAGWHARKTT